MIRISREADYGFMLMTALAQADGQPRSAATLAQTCQLPLPMVSKILKTLTRTGLLHSQRGTQGGYHLARAAAEISAVDIISVFEGPIAINVCNDDAAQTACVRQAHCTVSVHWHRINRAIDSALRAITLLEMSRPPVEPLHFQAIGTAITAARSQAISQMGGALA